MIQEAIREVIEKKNLTFENTKRVMDEIMQGEATQAQIAAFLTAMRMKGETIDEITACAVSMREHGSKVCHNGEVLDIVGTGGDEAYTFNISTITSFVVAAAGIPVAKHGNRSVSSKCGAADVLEALGARLDLNSVQNETILASTGMCFMFAPIYHSSMKYAAPVRREIKARTIFNILGPLANPASASMQLLGVYDKTLVEPMAQVLNNLSVKRAMVVYGNDGLDEISVSAPTTVCEVNNGSFKNYALNPADFGFEACCRNDLEGGDAKVNAKIAQSILNGEKGHKRNAVLLNAAACFSMAGKVNSMADGISLAAEMIDSGKAYSRLCKFVKATNEVM